MPLRGLISVYEKLSVTLFLKEKHIELVDWSFPRALTVNCLGRWMFAWMNFGAVWSMFNWILKTRSFNGFNRFTLVFWTDSERRRRIGNLQPVASYLSGILKTFATIEFSALSWDWFKNKSLVKSSGNNTNTPSRYPERLFKWSNTPNRAVSAFFFWLGIVSYWPSISGTHVAFCIIRF